LESELDVDELLLVDDESELFEFLELLESDFDESDPESFLLSDLLSDPFLPILALDFA